MFTQTLRRATPYGWVAVALAFVYLAGVLIMRQTAPIRLPTARSPAIGVPEGIYGTGPRIAHFYANSGSIVRGASAVICYGTREVQSLALDPPEELIKPALNRCFAVTPEKTRTYVLTAVTADGHKLSEALTIQVTPPPPTFTMIAVSAREIVRGERWSVCYSTENASSVRLEPNNVVLPAGKKRCGMLFPTATVEFRLTAIGEEGLKTTEKLPKLTVRPTPPRAVR